MIPARRILIAMTFFGLVFGMAQLVRVYAQSTDIRLERLEERAFSLRERVERLEQLQLQERLTRLETLGEANRTLLLMIGGAVAVQMVEMFARLGRRKWNWATGPHDTHGPDD